MYRFGGSDDHRTHWSGMLEYMELTSTDLAHLRRCADLAEAALESGDEPFGSMLVDQDNRILHEDRNRVSAGDHTRHPEFAIARWAVDNLTPDERAQCTVYTSGEHCPMCSAAHAWVGLGPIVYAVSSAQLATWLKEWQVRQGPVAALPVNDVAPGTAVSGPADELLETMRELHRLCYSV